MRRLVSFLLRSLQHVHLLLLMQYSSNPKMQEFLRVKTWCLSVQELKWRSTDSNSRQIRSVDHQKCSCPPGTWCE